MKSVILEEGEVRDLIGKFIIEINNNNPSEDITKNEQPEFWLEKRIYFIAYANLNGETYINRAGIRYSNKLLTISEFMLWFNSEDMGRHHRLLTRKEIKWLAKQLYKKNNDNK